MKKLILILFSIPQFSFAQSEKIVVNNAYEFVDAIGSNRIIEISNTIYLSEINEGKRDEHYWINTEWDKHELIVAGVYNLEIIGQGSAPIKIITSDVESEVVNFENCKNIKISNINAGHGPKKGIECEGGVFYFKNCQNITIENSIMYGSGSCGITTRDVKGLKCINSIIRGCTHEAVSLYNTTEIEFDKCEFSDNDFYDLFRIYNCINVSINECIIENNHNSCDGDHLGYNSAFHSLFDVNKSMTISINNCQINNNEACFLFNKANVVEIQNNKLENNEFKLGNFFEK